MVLTDAPCSAGLLGLGLRIEVTPATFKAQEARYKARSLEWFRTALQFRDDDWILHLDEESVIDKHTIGACIEFIERGEHDIGQVCSRPSLSPPTLNVISGNHILQRSTLLETAVPWGLRYTSCC